MLVLLWVGVPIAITVVAVLLIGVLNRPRRPAQTHESIADFERFRGSLGERQRQRRGGASRRRAS